MKYFFYKISALCGILLFSQVPLFVDQYAIRLEGHLSECNRCVESYKQVAQEGNKSLDEYIAKFIASSDLDFQREGALIRSICARAEFLQRAQLSLKESFLIFRPFVLVRYADDKVAQDAWKSFTFGFSFTSEGVVWAMLGALFGVLICAFIKSLFSRKSKGS